MKPIKTILAASFLATALYAQAGAPPTIMVLPDKTWCVNNGYSIDVNSNGNTKKAEDFDKAFFNEDLKNVTTAINGLMQDLGFPLKNYSEQSESDDDDDLFDEMFESAESGSGMQSNSIDVILQKTKPDIIMRIGWTKNMAGMQYNLSYRLEALDSYSNKAVASVNGETPLVARTTPIGACLKQAAADHMSDFAARLQTYFDDVQTNGREIRVIIGIVDNGAGMNFNKEYGGKELGQVIYDWMSDNTVNHTFNERTASRNRLAYDQVRIPLRDAGGRPQQARQFIEKLKRHLSAAPYNLRIENTSPTLGVGRIAIGEK